MSGSGLCQQILVTLEDGREFKAETNVSDTLRWEKVNKRGWFDDENTSVSQIAFLAWSALSRVKEYDAGYDEFSKRIAELEVKKDEANSEAAGPDPTGEEAGGGSSSSSP